ncbi:E3 SUMO-protein ligase ZBED1-like isoform X3 [Polyergus mexicanus]|uniref:E3 SUMO-protein ligase ZBED1-like isoform X3 n=1 Tax=Polyergus mexicanus TaxID=615972 RepID=UPI0038B65E82
MSTCSTRKDSEFEMDSIASSSSSNANTERAEATHPSCSILDVGKSQRSTKDTGKATKSEVWQNYTKIDCTSARCNICSKKIKHRGNTTNMMQHLRHSHRMHVPCANPLKRAKCTEGNDFLEDVDDPPPKIQRLPKVQTQAKSEKIDKAFQRMSSFKSGGSAAAKITNAILFMIAADNCPLSTVENKGFRALMKTTAPLYKVPNRKSITKEIELRYHEMKNAFRKNLAVGTTHTLTCDIWTDTSNQSYLGITNHYLTPELEIKNSCLGVLPLSERHTADYILRNLRDCLESFDIETSDVTAIVTDCGANIKKAAIDTFGASKHISCFAHVLSHVVPSVMKTLPEVENMFARVHSIVAITKRSVVAADELKRLQICNGKTERTALKLKQDVLTRWNSSFYMIERFLELREYIYPVLMKCPTAPEMLTREQMQVLEDCVLVLRPIENVITEISGETYPTGSMAIPIIRCMENALNCCIPVTKIGENMKMKIITKVQEKFEGIETCKLLAMSTILDPRLKKIHFRSAMTAVTAIADINKTMKSANCDPEIIAPTSKPSESFTVQSIWEFHDNLIANDMQSNDPSELHLELPVKHLNIIATSVPSERLFSKAGALKTERRNRLSGKRLNMLLFLGSLSEKDWGLA